MLRYVAFASMTIATLLSVARPAGASSQELLDRARSDELSLIALLQVAGDLSERGVLKDSSLLVAGINLEPRPLTRLQLNAFLPVEGDSGARIGATAQLAF